MCESLIGTSLGPYQLLEAVGHGGMAHVFRAYQPSMDRHVAVKLIHKRYATDASSSERFQREARLIARLEHPHVLPVYDFDGSYSPPYIVMRYLSGGTLRDCMLNEAHMLKPDFVMRTLVAIASALDYAHRQGIVHRDFKPSNIMFDGENNAFLTDFGIARMLADTDNGLTEHGVLVGTPEYMAPEQAMSEATLGPAADHYALGVVVFELLAGRLPFEAPTPISRALMHITEKPPRITEINNKLPAALNEVMERALAKKPEDRFASGEEFVLALGRAIGTEVGSPKPLAVIAATRNGHQTFPESDSETTLSERNKLVTVMRVNAADFVELLDEYEGAEAARSTTDTLMERFRNVVVQHNGQILDAAQATLTALWGAEVTKEDDAERAVRAALAIRQTYFETCAEELSEEPMPLRIAVHTGLTLLTPKPDLVGGSILFSVTGATMSITTRLCEKAEGKILISHDTFRLVRGIFDINPAESIRILQRSRKKSPAQLQAYEVTNAKKRAFRMRARGVERVETAMIGREAELDILQRAFLTVVEDHESQVVTIVGDAGLGKSRLAEEFETWVDVRPDLCRVFRGRAEATTDTSPFSLIRNLFSFRFEILDDDSSETVVAKISQGMAGLLLQHHADDEMVHLVGHLAGFDLGDSDYVKGLIGDPDQLAQRARQLFHRFFKRLAETQTVLVTLEDVHNADDASLDLLIELVTENSESNILLVFLTRPSLFHRRPTWARGQRFHRLMTLEPLDRRYSRDLVAEILKNATSVPQPLRDLLVERAEGNPLFLEELVKMLIEDRIIYKESEDVWYVEETRIDRLRVPPTLTGLLQARLDTLLVPERTVLQRAAVMGRVFTDIVINELGAADDQEVLARDIEALLSRLVDRGFLFGLETSSFEGGRDYTFAQNMIRELLYESLLRRQRCAYHAALADWMVTSRRADENPAAIAEHYEKAGRTDAALTYFERAGDRARRICAYHEAQTLYQHTLDLIVSPQPTAMTPMPFHPSEVDDVISHARAEGRLRLALGEVLRLRGSFDDATTHLERALELARAGEDDQAIAAVLYEQSQVASALGDYLSAQEKLDESLPLAERAGDSAVLAHVYYGLGDLLWRDCNYSEAIVPLEASLGHARAGSDPNAVLFALNRLGSVRMFQKHYDEARSIYEEGRQIAGSTGNRERLVAFLNNLGEIERLEGNYRTAQDFYLETLAMIRETGRREAESVVLANLGAAALHLDELAAAERYAQQSLASAHEIGMTRMVVGGLILFAQLASRKGENERALQLLGLVSSHPAADADLKEYAAPTINELRSKLAADDVEAGLENGRQLSLESTVSELLENFSKDRT